MTFWHIWGNIEILESYAGAEGELTTAHVIHVCHLSTVSVDESPVISESHLKDMEEMGSDRRT